MENPIKRKVIIEKSEDVPAISKEELEIYLQSIGGLIQGHALNAPPIIYAESFGVGQGWYGIIKKLIEEAIANGWNKELSQSKEKFGTLRFYINAAPREVHDVVSKYERISGETCETCGIKGKQRPGGWIETLCDDCYERTKIKK
jgi:hypothetical protein